MDAFSSSFLSSTYILGPKPPSPPPPPHLPHRISAVRIEERPPTTTPTPQQTRTTTPRKSPPPPRRSPPPPPQTFPATLFNALDNIVNTYIDPPSKPFVDPKFTLSDNFAPVDELPPTECEVIHGVLPPCLDGAYIRNGPNPQFLPRGPYHLFDGDGMLHALKISNGRATLCSRFVKTYKYTVEQANGSQVIPYVFSGFNGLTAAAARGAVSAARMLTGQFNPANGIGTANTSLAFFGNKLFALGESDLPYEIKISNNGEISTLGRYDFSGKLNMSMTAHPKIDPRTGEAFAFRYGPMPPYVTLFRFDSDGNKSQDVPIFSMQTPSFLHDFAITNKYAIFTEIQLGMNNPLDMIFKGGPPVGADPAKVPRIGIIPRYAKDESEMKWFEVPGFNIMHAINAWDEDCGDTVVMVAPNLMSVEHTMERLDLIHAVVEKVKIDLKTGIVSRVPLSTRNLDFAVVNPSYVGQNSRCVPNFYLYKLK